MSDRERPQTVGPRHRRLLFALLEERLPWNAWIEPAADEGVRLAKLTAAVDAVLEEELTEPRLVEALAHAVALARYWQEPDEVDRALARPAIRVALVPLADRVAAVRPPWWAAAVVPHEQWFVEWDGVDVPPVDAGVALARWRQDTLDDERRAAERPSDVRAGYSRHWWSAPGLSGLPSTIRPGPDGLVLVEDFLGWEGATCRPVEPTATPRIREITGAADWVDLVHAHPLDLTRSRRHDWWRATGVEGRWLIPDWVSVAQEHGAVHLTVAAYLQAAGRALPLGDGAHTVIAGWDPDRTWWLSDQLAPAGAPQRWVRAGEEWRAAD